MRKTTTIHEFLHNAITHLDLETNASGNDACALEGNWETGKTEVRRGSKSSVVQPLFPRQTRTSTLMLFFHVQTAMWECHNLGSARNRAKVWDDQKNNLVLQLRGSPRPLVDVLRPEYDLRQNARRAERCQVSMHRIPSKPQTTITALFTRYCQLRSPPDFPGLSVPRSSPTWGRLFLRVSPFMSVDRRLSLHLCQHHFNCCVPCFLRLCLCDVFPVTPFLLMLLDQAVGGSEDAVRQFSHLSIPVFPRFALSRVPATMAFRGSCTQGKGDHVGRMGPCESLCPAIAAPVGESEPTHPPPSHVSSHQSWSAHPSSSQFRH